MKKQAEWYCPRGCGKISTKKEDVSPGYFGACLECDEDFYKFELDTKRQSERKKRP
jgi:hypothetical protein